MTLVLRIQEPDLTPREVALRDGMVIGRLPESDCVLNDPKVSSRHAQIVVVEGGLAIEDLGSTNGTRVDGGVALTAGERHRLTEGMVLWLGRTRVEVGEPAPPIEATQEFPPGPEVTLLARERRSEQRAQNGDPAFEGETLEQLPPAAAGASVTHMKETLLVPEEPPPQAPSQEAAAQEPPAQDTPVAESSAAPSPSVVDAALQSAENTFLILVHGSERRVEPLPFVVEGEVLQATIGRSSRRAQVRIEDGSVSGVHARVFVRDDKYFVEDLGSTNGTCAGETRLVPHSPREIHTDEGLRFGAVSALFVSEHDAKGMRVSEERYEATVEQLHTQGKIDSEAQRHALTALVENGVHPAQSLLLLTAITIEDWLAAFHRGRVTMVAKKAETERKVRKRTLVWVLLVVAVALLAYIVWHFTGS